MAGTGRPALSRTPTPLRARFSRLWRRGRPAAATSPETPADPLTVAGQRLRLRREERQLSLPPVARSTSPSTTADSATQASGWVRGAGGGKGALERGWRDRLPEPPYLRTMLPLIERHLELEPGSLEQVLPEEELRHQQPRASGLLQRFTPGSIDVFTTWQGTVLYGLITLGLIYGLNLQQRRLASEGLLTVAPLPANSAPPERKSSPASREGRQILLGRYPELRPLDQAASGQGLRLWRRASSP